ncbi:MAG: hypothetical protein VX747_04440, partial [Actinomycetota bacterium]|nr:hypothetical protein [Actinomycetota bacterium]
MYTAPPRWEFVGVLGSEAHGPSGDESADETSAGLGNVSGEPLSSEKCTRLRVGVALPEPSRPGSDRVLTGPSKSSDRVMSPESTSARILLRRCLSALSCASDMRPPFRAPPSAAAR